MNKFVLVITFIIYVIKTFSQNNFIIFTENTEPIQLQYQGKLHPNLPQTDIKLTQIIGNFIKIKILFQNTNIPSIDTILYLYHPSKPVQNQDIIYVIQKDNKTIKYLNTLPSSAIQPIIPEIDTSIQIKTREEKTIQKIIFDNDSNVLCIDFIDTSDFHKALKHIQSTPNQDRKIVLIEHFIVHNCFNQKQALSIVEQVPFEVEKLKVMKTLLPKLTDVFDLSYWKNFLKYPTAQERFEEYYQQYLHSLKNKPGLGDSLLQILSVKIANIDNDISITKELRVILSHYSINMQHLEKIMAHINHDQYKEEVLKCAYFSLINKNDLEKTLNFVQFNETKTRLKTFYEKQNK